MRKHLTMLLFLPAVLFGFSGCLAVLAGGAAGGGVAYAKGDLRAAIDRDVSTLNSAVTSAGNDMGLIQVSSEADSLSGNHVFRTSNDRRVTINTKKTGDNISEVSIRVGTFGDEAMSNMILERIRQNL